MSATASPPAPVTLAQARERYFLDNAFGEDGGYSEKWVHVKVGPLTVTIPNTPARVRAVRFHDLHHVLTGYRTDFHGEAEISAWEIATGCRGFWAAWILNLNGMAAGLLRWPKDLFRAFVRGRHSRNLYGEAFGEGLLSRTVEQVRAELLPAAPPDLTVADGGAFLLWASAALGVFLVELAVVLAPLAALVLAILRWVG